MRVNLSRHSPRRFLFTVAGGYGHLHPLVPLARALREAGHEVAFTGGASLRAPVEAAGFDFFRVGGKLAADPEYQQFKARQQVMPLGIDTELFIYTKLWCGIATRMRTPDLVAVAHEWKPDMLIRESGEYAAAIAAEHLGLPHATIPVTASLKGQAIFEREAPSQLDPIREAWGLPPDPDLASLYRYLNLAYSPPSFAKQDIGGPGIPDTNRAIPATTRFVRQQFFDQATSRSLPDWVEQLREQPTVYATLGTEINKEPGVYPLALQTIVEGLRDLPVNVVVTVGRDKDPADFGPQPTNVHIERYIPQSLLLPRCDLMVMHGGSNTLLQAVDIGLPFVVVPLLADQFFNASVAQGLGLGQVVRTWRPEHPGQVELGQLTPASIRAAVKEVLNNPEYGRNIERLKAEMDSLPSQEYAVGLVERVVTEHEGTGDLTC